MSHWCPISSPWIWLFNIFFHSLQWKIAIFNQIPKGGHARKILETWPYYHRTRWAMFHAIVPSNDQWPEGIHTIHTIHTDATRGQEWTPQTPKSCRFVGTLGAQKNANSMLVFFLVSGTIQLLGDPPFMVNPPNMGVFGRCIARRVTWSKHVDICLNKSKHLWYFMMRFHDSWGEWGSKPPKHGNVGKSRTEAWLHR